MDPGFRHITQQEQEAFMNAGRQMVKVGGFAVGGVALTFAIKQADAHDNLSIAQATVKDFEQRLAYGPTTDDNRAEIRQQLKETKQQVDVAKTHIPEIPDPALLVGGPAGLAISAGLIAAAIVNRRRYRKYKRQKP